MRAPYCAPEPQAIYKLKTGMRLKSRPRFIILSNDLFSQFG